jgi:hypothetical protein
VLTRSIVAGYFVFIRLCSLQTLARRRHIFLLAHHRAPTPWIARQSPSPWITPPDFPLPCVSLESRKKKGKKKKRSILIEKKKKRRKKRK